MVDRINKLLLKLDAKRRRELLALIEAIRDGKLDGLDVKKLSGTGQSYRVRKGPFRILFTRMDDGTVIIRDVVRRSDHTY